MNGTEKRKYERYEIEESIQIIAEQGDLVLTVMSEDLSVRGAKVTLPGGCGLEEGMEVAVKFIARNDSNSKQLICRGVVVRNIAADQDDIAGVALMFDEPLDLKLNKD